MLREAGLYGTSGIGVQGPAVADVTRASRALALEVLRMADEGSSGGGRGGDGGSRGGRRGRPYSRADHRARSHDSAHASDAGEGDPASHAAPRGPDHPLVPRGPASLVRNDDELHRLIERLRAARVFAYDSEFIGELTYFPKLCLIQTASAHEV